MRWLLILMAIVAAAGGATWLTASDSPVRVWFESLEKTGDEKLLTVGGLAPWEAEATGQPSALVDPLPELPVNEVPLEEQHRTNAEIAEWLTEVISESLSFNADTYENVLRDSAQYFHQAGYDQYILFLQSGQVGETLRQGNLRMVNVVREAPFLLTKGSVDGRYKWLYEIPVLMSYMRQGSSGYGGNAPVSREVVVNVQIGRYDNVGPQGLLIESFEVRPRPNTR